MFFVAAMLAILSGLFYAAGPHEIGSLGVATCQYGSPFCDNPPLVLVAAGNEVPESVEPDRPHRVLPRAGIGLMAAPDRVVDASVVPLHRPHQFAERRPAGVAAIRVPVIEAGGGSWG